MNNFDDDGEGGGISGAKVLTGCAFNEEISKLAVSRTSSVLAASTWSGDLHVFSLLAGGQEESKEYVGRFTSASSSSSGEIKSPILDCAFSPSNGDNGCVCFGTLSGELLCGDSATRVLKTEGGDQNVVMNDDSVKVVGTHKDAIKNVFFLEDKPDVVFSAGWDLYLNAWDLRMPSRSRKILSNALPFKPHLADAKNNRVLFVSAEGKERRYDSSVILLTNAPSFERTTSRSFLNKKDFGEGQEQQQQQLGQYQHVRSCALSFNPKHSYGAQREEEEERRDSSRKQQQKQQPSCDFVLGLSNSKCSVEFFREELDEKYAYNFLCHRETVRADDAPKFAFQRQQQFKQKKNQQRKVLLHPINGCAFIQQSTNLLVTGGGDGKVELWSTKTREHLETVCDLKKGSSISQLAVNEPGDLIAVAVTKNNQQQQSQYYSLIKEQESLRQALPPGRNGRDRHPRCGKIIRTTYARERLYHPSGAEKAAPVVVTAVLETLAVITIAPVKYIFFSSFFPCTTQRAREKSEFFVFTIFTKTAVTCAR